MRQLEDMLITDQSKLQKGDIIIANCSAELRCYRVMELPRISKLKTYYNGTVRYVAVKCQVDVEFKTSTNKGYNNKAYVRKWKEFQFKIPADDAAVISVDLNFKQIIKIN